MKKLIFKFWITNFFISITLFIIYRIIISQTETTESNSFEFLINILDILLSLGYSLFYLVATLVSSLTFFLNNVEKIRNNYYLSFFTFSGLPFLFVLYLMIVYFIDFYPNEVSFMMTLFVFSLLYLIITISEFLIFRKKIKTIDTI